MEQINIDTKKPYQGNNEKDLESCGYGSNKWGTFLTWRKLGFSIKKGEKGISCFHPTVWIEKKNNGEEKEKKGRKYFTLFNEEQVKPYELN